MNNTVWILGTRGSMPMGGPGFRKYGGDTPCILVRLAGQDILLDAGTGLMNLPPEQMDAPALTMLLTHYHIDHLLGLPLCPFVLRPGKRLDIYGAPRYGMDAHTALSRLLSRPLWPVGPDDLPAELVFHDLPKTLDLGPVQVETMEGVHPDGVSLLRLTGGGRCIAYVSDCTLTEVILPELTRFVRDCDLLLCDGQYSSAEWPARSGFGHSTWTAAARLAAACGAKQARVLHHDTAHTDDILDQAVREVHAICPACTLAVQGEVIQL